MQARSLLHERQQLRTDAFYVVAGVCVLRYDNEAGKGDHKHVGPTETLYHFTTPDRLLTDFWQDVDQWRPA